MYFSRNCSETFLIQYVMKAIIQLMRNKIIEVYTKILAGCRQKAEHSQIDVLRGALPAGGISVSCGVDLALPMVSSHQCWDTTNSTLGQGVCGKRSVKHKEKFKELFLSPFYGGNMTAGKQKQLRAVKKTCRLQKGKLLSSSFKKACKNAPYFMFASL